MTDTPNYMKLRAIFVGGPLHLRRFPVNEPVAFEIESTLRTTDNVLVLGRAALSSKFVYQPMDEGPRLNVGLWKSILGVDVIYTTYVRTVTDESDFQELISRCVRNQTIWRRYISPHHVPEDIIISPDPNKEEHV